MISYEIYQKSTPTFISYTQSPRFPRPCQASPSESAHSTLLQPYYISRDNKLLPLDLFFFFKKTSHVYRQHYRHQPCCSSRLRTRPGSDALSRQITFSRRTSPPRQTSSSRREKAADEWLPPTAARGASVSPPPVCGHFRPGGDGNAGG
jgi:hypothetical protein